MSEECEECKPGLPAYMGTFADLMSLLMCFFVLLLSFAEMEVEKFQQLSGSMKEAFGVQKNIVARDNPKGTSIIAKEFSPGKPVPTPIKAVQQITTDDTKPNLDFTDSNTKNLELEGGDPEQADTSAQPDSQEQKQKEAEQDAQKLADIAEAKAIEAMLKKALNDEIRKGLVEVMSKENQVMIRVRERGSFKSGRANIQAAFVPTLDKISRILGKTRGHIVVAGHTDDVPISTRRFPSNWELSAARAATFVHFLKRRGKIDPKRLEIRAYADTQPLDPAKTPQARAKNRRVEILLSAKADTRVEKEVTADSLKKP